MKNFLLVFVVLLLFSCAEENKIALDTLSRSGEICPKCPRVSIEIPVAIGEGKLADAINTALEEELIYILNYDDDVEITTAKQAMESFKKNYKELSTKFGETAKWEAEIEGDAIYEDANLLTIALDSYLFTGGAHGYSATSILTFDKLKGIEIDISELFEDEEGFLEVVELHFRIKEKIPENGAINDTGFMFRNDAFHLSENMGFTNDGIYLIYNQYEVASYADGPIELVIPFEDVNPFLKTKYQVAL